MEELDYLTGLQVLVWPEVIRTFSSFVNDLILYPVKLMLIQLFQYFDPDSHIMCSTFESKMPPLEWVDS